jgi:hypothetical protein
MTNPVQAIISGNGRSINLDDLLVEQQKQRQTPALLTLDDYAGAVRMLVKLAQKDCGGSRAAAQVLLSTYNGDNWHCDLTDLCNLDAGNYRAAIIVIRGRVELNCEPQRLIDDGNAVFAELEQEWQAYHVKNRYQNQG